MSENQRVELRGLKVDWEGDRTERLLTSVQARLGRRLVLMRAALASATLVLLAAGAALALRTSHAPAVSVASNGAAAPSASPGAIRLRDGSEIQPSGASEVRVVEESASHVLVELVRGAARYSVIPNPARAFEVRSGSVTVRVVGTEFAVERRGESTWVEVVRGKVLVSPGGGDPETTLAAGESGLFPRVMAVNAATRAGPGLETGSPAERQKEATRAYRAHLAHKDYGSAFALLARDPTLAGDSVQDLMLAADVARLSDHPSAAVPYLERVIRDHPGDQRAPLAAFTLGRTLSGLGRTREAMGMFGRLRRTWPSNALAEDALLRQAEAASGLGELGVAHGLAEQYDHDYPSGRRRAEVRHYAHLE